MATSSAALSSGSSAMHGPRGWRPAEFVDFNNFRLPQNNPAESSEATGMKGALQFKRPVSPPGIPKPGGGEGGHSQPYIWVIDGDRSNPRVNHRHQHHHHVNRVCSGFAKLIISQSPGYVSEDTLNTSPRNNQQPTRVSSK